MGRTQRGSSEAVGVVQTVVASDQPVDPLQVDLDSLSARRGWMKESACKTCECMVALLICIAWHGTGYQQKGTRVIAEYKVFFLCVCVCVLCTICYYNGTYFLMETVMYGPQKRVGVFSLIWLQVR